MQAGVRTAELEQTTVVFTPTELAKFLRRTAPPLPASTRGPADGFQEKKFQRAHRTNISTRNVPFFLDTLRGYVQR